MKVIVSLCTRKSGQGKYICKGWLWNLNSLYEGGLMVQNYGDFFSFTSSQGPAHPQSGRGNTKCQLTQHRLEPQVTLH